MGFLDLICIYFLEGGRKFILDLCEINIFKNENIIKNMYINFRIFVINIVILVFLSMILKFFLYKI